MTTGLQGFPIISQLNHARKELWSYHDSKNNLSPSDKVGRWLGHKAVTVISIPANIAAVGLGVLGMATTACTIGAAKTFIFAFTLGRIKPEFPTGFLWFGERTYSSIGQVLSNLYEVTYDVCDLGYRIGEKAYRLAKHIVIALKIDRFIVKYVIPALNRVLKEIGRVLNFIGKRLDDGFGKAWSDESKLELKFTTPPVVKDLNEFNEGFSIFREHAMRETDKHKMLHTITHIGLSLVAVPVNAITCIATGILTAATLPLFVAKGTFTAVTTLPIPVPTGCMKLGCYHLTALGNTLRGAGELTVIDPAVFLYQVADALHITTVVAKVTEVALYALEACFCS